MASQGSRQFDLFVIGGGSGGVRAARVAAKHGARVGVAESDRFGGTCVIRGCVPKKLLVYAGRFADDFADAAGFGWTVPPPVFDWASLIAAKDKEIARLEGLYRATLMTSGVTLYDARATIIGPHEVRLEGTGETITADKILIATGGRPNRDDSLTGIEHAITSDEAFHLETLPKRIIIAGGGYIAVEFASIFNALGSHVTLLYRGEKILKGFDDDLRDALTDAMRARGVTFVFGDVFARLETSAAGIVATTRGGGHFVADTIMFAIGRSPNVAGLGLEAAGVAVDPKRGSAIVVDDQARTSVESIFAVGDVTNRVNLTPVAIREGHTFANVQFGGQTASVDYDCIPTAVFATPEIGTVGLTEAEARARFGDIDVYKAQFRPMRNVLAGRDERTLMKLVVDTGTQRVVGVHIAGPDAGEIVQMAAIALRLKATKADFDATMALHPSAAEELVTMRDKWIAPGEAAG